MDFIKEFQKFILGSMSLDSDVDIVPDDNSPAITDAEITEAKSC